MKTLLRLNIAGLGLLGFAVVNSLVAPATVHAQNGTWITDGDATWTDSANWLDSIIANGADNTAFFTAELTGATRTVTLGGDRTIGNILFTDGTTSSNNLVLTGSTLTLDATAAPIINVTQSDRILAIESIIAGSDGLTKTGPGELRLRAANTYTGTTGVNGGNLMVDAAGSLASSALALGGGRFDYRANSLTQSFTTTAIDAGVSAVRANVASSTNQLNLGAITRTAGGTLNFETGTGTLTTTTANTNGILGGWATHNNADWAVGNGGASNVTGFSGYTTLPTSGGAATTNYRMTAGTTLAGSFSVNSLKLEAPSGNLALGSNVLTIASGGLLVLK
jgi:fibronectin-binding autotransporter adhesin